MTAFPNQAEVKNSRNRPPAAPYTPSEGALKLKVRLSVSTEFKYSAIPENFQGLREKNKISL